MKKISDPIVFFGSGPVAAKSLELLSLDFNVEAVITKPKLNTKDKTPVADLSEKLKIKSYFPSNKSELDTLFKDIKLVSKIGILIDYGIIVSERVVNYFPYKIVNSHFSLLPQWRGADPISFSILNGDKTTGVSLMLVSSGVDEGELLAQEKLEIKDFNSVRLTDLLIELSDKMLKEYVPKYLAGALDPYPQPTNVSPTFSRKLFKKDGEIDWNKSALQIDREIKAFISWPKSFTEIYGIPVIITKVRLNSVSGKPGQVSYDKKSINIKCSGNSLDILRLKPAGKPEMDVVGFISGYKRYFQD